MNVPEGIARYLATRGIGITYAAETAGGNAFIDMLPVISQNTGVTVGFYHSGGVEADARLPYDTTTLQIVVRGATDPRTAIAMWYSIFSQVQGLHNVVLPNGDYLVSCIVQQSGPVRMGPDETGRHRYSMNLRCEVRNPTENRS